MAGQGTFDFGPDAPRSGAALKRDFHGLAQFRKDKHNPWVFYVYGFDSTVAGEAGRYTVLRADDGREYVPIDAEGRITIAGRKYGRKHWNHWRPAMRFHRFGKYEFRDTERKCAAFAHKQKAECEALPLFADQVAAEQIDMGEEMTAHRLQWERQQATDRKCRADKWYEARRRLNGYQEPVHGALLAYWQGCKWPTDPSHFLSMLHMYDTGRLSLNIPKA